MFAKLILQTSRPEIQPTLDYLRHVYRIRKHMQDNSVTAEVALERLGDLRLPVVPQQTDPFNGCSLLLGIPTDKPTDPHKRIGDNAVFEWRTRDLREAEEAEIKILDKHLPPETRTLFMRFAVEYVWAALGMIRQRLESREITLLQAIKATNASQDYLREQMKLHLAQLNQTLQEGNAQYLALLSNVAVGLGIVLTTAFTTAVMIGQSYQPPYNTMSPTRPVRCTSRYTGGGVTRINCF